MAKKVKQTKEKPLEKMTATELREAAKGLDGITGVHGMNKAELIADIQKARGIQAPARKTAGLVRDVKKRIRELRAVREKAVTEDDQRMAAIYKKRISRLKKQTRKIG
ncbi:MAG: Rho termination factor N-terminal domain-containing protein [Desulfobacterales bacterium]|nr:Rho termination factor N-terminal domain-containing protein [Desulfobacterales bacterium]